jgi:hypothetical protein
VDRIREVAGEARQLSPQPLDGIADPHRNCLAGSLGVSALRSGSPRQAQRTSEFTQERVALGVE